MAVDDLGHRKEAESVEAEERPEELAERHPEAESVETRTRTSERMPITTRPWWLAVLADCRPVAVAEVPPYPDTRQAVEVLAESKALAEEISCCTLSILPEQLP